MVDRREVCADPLDLPVDEVVDHLRHRTWVPIEIGHVVARRHRPAVAVPAGVEDDDVVLPDLLALREAALDVRKAVPPPGPGDRPEVDHQARPVQLVEADPAEVPAGLAVVARRIDVRAGVHVRLHEHRALAVPVMRRDVGDLDRGELGPRGHSIAPGLRKVDEAGHGWAPAVIGGFLRLRMARTWTRGRSARWAG